MIEDFENESYKNNESSEQLQNENTAYMPVYPMEAKTTYYTGKTLNNVKENTQNAKTMWQSLGVLFMLILMVGCAIWGYNGWLATEKIENQPYVILSNFSRDVVDHANASVVSVFASSTAGTSAGSGVCYKQSGGYMYIITNHHVIEDCNTFYVTTANAPQTQISATLIGTDKQSDIAVLRIREVNGIDVSTLKSSYEYNLAENVFTIGNPLGTLTHTFSNGYISNTSVRSVVSESGVQQELISVNMNINSGNSGGPLFNADGDIIGIVNSKVASSIVTSGGSTSVNVVEGICFAIPCSTVYDVVQEIEQSYATYGGMGYVTGRTNAGVTVGYSVFGHSVMISSVDETSDAAGLVSARQTIEQITLERPSEEGVYETIYHLNVAKETEVDASTLALYCNIIFQSAQVNDRITLLVKDSTAVQAKEVVIEYTTQYVYQIPTNY